jgi:predicted GNAT superfamily acetyltransferase
MPPNFIRIGDHGIAIRRAEIVADYHACQEAQRLAWGISDASYLVPVATMVGANLHGGLVLGAFLPDGRAVAMSFGFLGRIEDRFCLYSQLTGVIPSFQAHGLGKVMKLAQRDHARAAGLSLIAWAFDPLQAGNAYFNVERLGASVGRYIENMYGERTDALNAGVPTDRVIAEWDLDEEQGTRLSLDPRSALALPRLIRSAFDPAGRVVPTSVESVPEAPRVLLEIPVRIAELRRDQAGLAEDWRRAVREAFQSSFAAGYRALGFVRDDTADPRRGFYLLQRMETGDGIELL